MISPSNANQDLAKDFSRLLADMPRAAGDPVGCVGFRRQPVDFFVREILDFELAGEGDHLCLLIEKTRLTTHDVIDRLVTKLSVKPVDVGYFGLKDKQAVTQQWFSIHWPGRAATDSLLALGDGVTVLEQTWHTRKLRIGSHKANQFKIVLRDVNTSPVSFSDRVAAVFEQGFPNYFAEQRFGFGAQNINKALTLFRGERAAFGDGNAPRSARQSGRRTNRRPSRRQRSLYLSAARGFLFNQVLAERVQSGGWLTPLPDEKLLLSGTRSYFEFDSEPGAEATILERLLRHDIHTSGVLWGRGDCICDWERQCVQPFSELANGLEQAGLEAGRRALRGTVFDGSINWVTNDTAVLSFELPAGCYATSLLREVCRTVA